MSIMSTQRFADAGTAGRYPLPVAGAADWQQRQGGWCVDVALGELPAGTILVPSLAFPTAPGADGQPHQWTLSAGGDRWSLQRVPADPAAAPAPSRPPAATSSGAPVSAHIDCFRVHRRIGPATLHLRVDADELPASYLICVSSRAFTIAAPPLPTHRACLAAMPPPRSQMNAPAAIAPRICSPTCVSMVLNAWQRPHDWLCLAAECLDTATGMYGVWPLALQAAARRGSVGAVEVFADWSEPLAVLARGVPLVTSIRFAAGELPGAPLQDTGGHLVVVHGAGPDHVAVCDPAAAEGTVPRTYPAAAFSGAWLRHRGAAYILPP